MSARTYLVPVLSALALGGCAIGSSKFDCPGMPDGAVCKTPQQVYKATNNADHLYADPNSVAQDADKTRPGTGVAGAVAGTSDGRPGGGGSDAKASADASALLPRQLLEPVTQPMPVLEPAQTMRAWIAPWIDKRGDLHFPSLLFTEVTPRRWSIGEAVGRTARILVPLGVETSDPSGGRGAFDGPTYTSDDGAGEATRALQQVPGGGAPSGPVPGK